MTTLIKTIPIKLDIDPALLGPTVSAYTDSFNHICLSAFDKNLFNHIKLHKLHYSEIRNTFNLPSQLTCSVLNKSSEALSSIKKKKYTKCPVSKQQSIRYDKNSYSLFLDKSEVSLLTLNKRIKCKLILSDYHKEYFQDWKYSSADLIIRKNKVYLHVVFQKDIENTNPNGTFVGLDRGIANIAVTSNNKFYTGKHVLNISNHYRNLRSKLQKVNSKSAKRHLRKISGKERRFKSDVNHVISKQIINELNSGDTLVLEDLKGIRNQRLRKEVRYLINNWNFYQLEQYLTYKANAKGVGIVKVPAQYTSQTCSKCGYCSKDNRKTQSRFKCICCGYEINADLNASRNIRNRALSGYMPDNGAEVNQPNVSGICSQKELNFQEQASGFSQK